MKKRTSSRILRAAVSLCLVFALFCTMGMMAFAQADDALGTIREVFPDENLAQVMAVVALHLKSEKIAFEIRKNQSV